MVLMISVNAVANDYDINYDPYNTWDMNKIIKAYETIKLKVLPIPKEVSAKGINFIKGERVTCIYDAVFSWTNGEEYIKPIPMSCLVVLASPVWNDVEANYQHIQVDCSADIASKSSSKAGIGMVKNHKLNFKQRWYTSKDCYHLETND